MSPPTIPQLFLTHWQLSWPLTAMAAASALLYASAQVRVRSGWPLHRTVAFLGGIAVVLIALESGVGTYDDRLLSVHMVQHLLLLLVAPLLLLAGQPALLTLRALPRERRPAVARRLARAGRWLGPVRCLAIFCAVVLGTHLPAFYDATVRHPPLHDLEHALYVLAGVVLWWPILDVDPAPQRRLGGLARLIYLLAAMPAMALLGAYLNRHPTVVYPAYVAPAHVLGVSAITVQQQAGAIMWVGGNTIMVLVGLWAVMARLIADERRQRMREAHAPTETTA